MKWIKGNENFQQYYKRFIDNFRIDDEYIIWGSFNRFKLLKNISKGRLKIKYCVDIDTKKQGTVVDGISIVSPENLKKEKNVKVIVATQAYREVYMMLEELGIDEKQYCNYMEITCFWNWYYNKKLILTEISYMVNNICTLKCKGCIAFINHAKNPHNVALDSIKKNFDDLFNSIDYIDTIQIAGGEIFLHNELEGVFDYLYKNYKNQYRSINIITNGTIVPNQKVLEACKRSNVMVIISDYNQYIGNKSVVDQLIYSFDKNEISYKHESTFGIRSGENKWFDMGNPLESRNLSEESLVQLFNNCTSVCRCMYNSKLYYCNRQLCASFNLNFSETESDYFKLYESAKQSKKEYALDLIKFNLGYIDLGYLSFCNRCNGFGELVNKNYISAGEQI